MPQIQEVDLSLGNLESMDGGKIARLVKVNLQRLSQDCINRPNDDTPRRLSVEFEFIPLADETGECDSATCKILVKSKVPTYKSKKYEVRVGQRGFAFDADFPDSIDQAPLFKPEQE